MRVIDLTHTITQDMPVFPGTDQPSICGYATVPTDGFRECMITLDSHTAFHEYEMHRVSIGVVGLNTDALEFYKKNGFKQEGILEETFYYNDEYSDFKMMRILS